MSRIYLHTAIILGFLIIIVVLASVVKKWFSKADEKARLDRQKQLEDVGMSLSFPLNQYEDWADQIELALAKFSDIQDDPEKAVSVLKKAMNELDALQLITAYGTRPDI
ncbi:MAG: hypothetical protein AAFN10_25540, partial [Bacteroidota bacterium]